MDAFQDCYATFKKGRLIVGNHGIERVWDITSGAPKALSIRDKLREREWVWSPPYQDTFRRSTLPLSGVPQITLSATVNDEAGASEKHLLINVRLLYPSAELAWALRIWPNLPLVFSQYTVRQIAAVAPVPVEPYYDNGIGGLHIVMVDDRLDFFGIAPLHLAYTVAKFTAQSDYHDNLVQEKHAYTYPKERIRESGHYLHLRDRNEKGGLLAIKIAPPPEEQLNYPGFDFAYSGKTLAIAGSGISDAEIKSGHPFSTYASAIGITDGSEKNGVNLFYQLDRARHKLLPERHFSILANNWGAGHGSKNMGETLVLNEIDTAAKLGLTHVQLDAGWESGAPNSNFVIENANKPSTYQLNQNYWEINRTRFPKGWQTIINRAREKGIRLGFWFVPDETNDYANWEKDRDVVLELCRTYGFDTVKIDGVSIYSKKGEHNFIAFLNGIWNGSGGKICINYDITGGRPRRTGHFYGTTSVGNLFIENRYGKDRSYFPYRTMRNLWQLCKYIPSYRLLMEFIDPENQCENYDPLDPFRPEAFSIEYICAAVLFASPLCWMETHQLSLSNQEKLAALIRAYRPHQKAILTGRVYPIGEEPSGRAWTGFQSVVNEHEGYLIFFREINDRPSAFFQLHGLPPGIILQTEKIAGARQPHLLKINRAGQAKVRLSKPASFCFLRYSVALA